MVLPLLEADVSSATCLPWRCVAAGIAPLQGVDCGANGTM